MLSLHSTINSPMCSVFGLVDDLKYILAEIEGIACQKYSVQQLLLSEIGTDIKSCRQEDFLRTVEDVEIHGILHYTEEWATK